MVHFDIIVFHRYSDLLSREYATQEIVIYWTPLLHTSLSTINRVLANGTGCLGSRKTTISHYLAVIETGFLIVSLRNRIFISCR